MYGLLRALFVAYPLTFLGHYVGGKLINPGVLFCALIAAAQVLGRGPALRAVAGWRWSQLFLAFVLIGSTSLLLSPYLDEAYVKGITQIGGLLIALLAASAIIVSVQEQPIRYVHLIKSSVGVLGGLALIGLVQSVVVNILRLPQPDLSFLNDIAGGHVWSNPGNLGPVQRAASLFAEPAAFCAYLGLAAGIALIRIGFLGEDYSRAVAAILSKQLALIIVAGYLVSLSLLGYFQLLLTVAFIWITSRRFTARGLMRLGVRLALVLGTIAVIAQQTGSQLSQKLGTVSLIINPELATDDTATVSVSALALASNLDVALSHLPNNPLLGIGFGAHPVAYNALVPYWLQSHIIDLEGLNADDGGSLLIRLLSETGLLGTGVFLAGCALVWLRARRAILRAVDLNRVTQTAPTVLLTASIGITSSMASSLLFCLARSAVYYDPMFWMLLALTAAVPVLLQEAVQLAKPMQRLTSQT